MSDYQWIEFAKDKFICFFYLFFFYFSCNFEQSFFNILSLKVIGVVLPPQAGALDVYRINKALFLPSLYFSSTQTHESVRQTVSTTTDLLFIL